MLYYIVGSATGYKTKTKTRGQRPWQLLLLLLVVVVVVSRSSWSTRLAPWSWQLAPSPPRPANRGLINRSWNLGSGRWRGGVAVGLRTFTIKMSRVRSPASARLCTTTLYDDSGQVVHARVPRRRQYSLLYGVVKLRTSIFGERTQVCSLDRLSPRARDAKPASLRHLRAHLRVFMT